VAKQTKQLDLFALPTTGEHWEQHWVSMPEFIQRDLMPWRSINVFFGTRELEAPLLRKGPGPDVPEAQSFQVSLPVHFESPEDRKAFSDLVGIQLNDTVSGFRFPLPYGANTVARARQAFEDFARLVGQRSTKAIWYPEAEIGRMGNKRWVSGEYLAKPRFPLYIVSKGRWENRLTSTSFALSEMGLPHFIVVEERERKLYEQHKDPLARIIVLDPKYQEEYDACDDLGMTKSKGPGPARNFAWDHSVENGAAWHWVMDDNIYGFYRLNKNLKVKSLTGAVFAAMEGFALRYANVSMAGPNYFMFASRKSTMPPYILNTRIYSCNLIRNDSPYRWRGRYNEDTDISLRMLKAGLVTVQFNAFLQRKATTQTFKGGNTAEFYDKEGTKPKSEMQVKLHPDISTLVFKWGRWHHNVDYSVFARNHLKRHAGLIVPNVVDNFGMELKMLDGAAWDFD